VSHEVLYYVCASIAVILSGLAKGGFAGVGALAMPVMAMGVEPVAGAAILLPILIVQDVISVWAFRRTFSKQIILIMVPGMALGVLLGYAYASRLSEKAVLGALGVISMAFGLHRLWVERGNAMVLPSNSPKWLGTLFGVVSGFTSQIAHAGAPPFQMWVLPRRLPRDSLVGTTAISFALVNWMKVPAYAAMGQFTARNLSATAALLPLALGATLAGVALVRRINAARFYTVIYALMALLGAKLIFDALS
jgi:uncharacterized membrane protein YfcA